MAKTTNFETIAREADVTNLDAAQLEIKRALERGIADLKKRAKEATTVLVARRRAVVQKDRTRERQVRQSMAFVIGEFLLRNGPGDATVQAIVSTEAFEEFTRGVRYRGRRELFGLSPIAEEPKAEAKRSAPRRKKAA